jgi:uncharacterized membrane protein
MDSEILIISEQKSSSMLPPSTGSANINVDPAERIVSVLAGTALAMYGLRHLGSLGGVALTITGGLLLSRGITGYCMVNNALGRNTANRKTSAMEAKGRFLINKPRAEVYAYWRRLENLPLFMKHLENVTVEDGIRSTWRAQVPGNLGSVSWEAVITEDRPGELLSWASLPGSTVDNAGEVKFNDGPAGEGTEIQVSLSYRLPAGDVGTIAGKLFSPFVENMINDDIKRFKSIIETGEMPSNEPQQQAPSRKGRQPRKKNADTYATAGSTSEEINGSDLLERPSL